MSKYVAVASEHIGTCAALGFAVMSMGPMVVCSGEDADEVLAEALATTNDPVIVDVGSKRIVNFRSEDE